MNSKRPRGYMSPELHAPLLAKTHGVNLATTHIVAKRNKAYLGG